jgi:hypothetical protein
MDMTLSEQKVLIDPVRDAVIRGTGNFIGRRHVGHRYLPKLRTLGFLNGNELTKAAFLSYVETFEIVPCPMEVLNVVDSFELNVQFRKAEGVIKDRIDRSGGGLSYRNLATIFIGDFATIATWFHEVGHVLFGCIKHNAEIGIILTRLEREAKAHYPIVISTGNEIAQRLDGARGTLPKGRYFLINGGYHGVDHSGNDAEAESDEIWAILFEKYCNNRELVPSVRSGVEEIIVAIKALPKPLEPCDPD